MSDYLIDYLVAKANIQAVKLSLEFRRDAIIQRKNPKNTDVIADLTTMIQLLDEAFKTVLAMDGTITSNSTKLFKQHAEITRLKKENEELLKKNNNLIEGI